MMSAQYLNTIAGNYTAVLFFGTPGFKQFPTNIENSYKYVYSSLLSCSSCVTFMLFGYLYLILILCYRSSLIMNNFAFCLECKDFLKETWPLKKMYILCTDPSYHNLFSDFLLVRQNSFTTVYPMNCQNKLGSVHKMHIYLEATSPFL